MTSIIKNLQAKTRALNKLNALVKNFLLELFFPSFCLGCKREVTYLCQDCKSILEISEYNYCLCNKNPFRLPPENKSGKCKRCRDKKLYGLYFALLYNERSLTRKLIHQFKYRPYVKDLAKVLAGILIEHFIIAKNNTAVIWQNSVLIPVPLEKNKLKSRGYNQAEELAKELSKILQIPLMTDVLIKIKGTLSQISLSAEKRQKNIKGAFLVKNSEKIKKKKIFLVDDVYTTGATMEECSRVLREAEAKSVWGIAVAREG